MSRLLIGAITLLGLGLLLRWRARAPIRVDESKRELTLEQLFGGVIPENVKRTWTTNKEKEDENR